MQNNLIFNNGFMVLRDTSVSPAVPTQVAALQDASVGWETESKPLYGGNKWPLTVAVSKNKMSVKAKHTAFNAGAIARIVGGAASTGQVRRATEPVANPSGAFTVSHSASNFVADLGVTDHTGQPMQPTGSSPAIGAYTVNSSGTYTFNVSESGTLQASYEYSDSTGTTTRVVNSAPSAAPTFEVVLFNEYTDEQGTVHKKGIRIFAVVFTKLNLTSKIDDWSEEDIEGDVLARSSDGYVFEDYRG